MESSYRRFSVTAPIAASCVSLYATPHFVLRPVLSQLSMQFTSVRFLFFIIFREKRNCCVQISFSAHSSIPFFYRNCKVKIWQKICPKNMSGSAYFNTDISHPLILNTLATMAVTPVGIASSANSVDGLCSAHFDSGLSSYVPRRNNAPGTFSR